MQRPHSRHPVRAREDVGALRRAIARLAATEHSLRPGRAELVATELGTNLLRHADPGGYALYRRIEHGIELLTVDSGPGMNSRALSLLAKPVNAAPTPAHPAPDVAARRGGGLSAGLAAVRRMSTEFDFYSSRRGTVLLARLTSDGVVGASRWRYGAVNTPLGDMGESGDAWSVALGETGLAAVVVDGLGHGAAAAVAARATIKAFEERPVEDVERFLRRCHEAMRGTRGAVVGVCVLDLAGQQLTWAGIGNIVGRVHNGEEKQHLLSRPGTLGTHLAMPRAHVQRARWTPGSTLVVTTDGVHSGWDLASHPGLLDRDPTVIAAALYRDHVRSTDDATVLVVQDRT